MTSEPRRAWIFANKKVKRLIVVLVATSHVVGLVCAVDAIMKNRTAQGAIAWSMSLVTVPYVMVPIYLVFGRQRFEGWVRRSRSYRWWFRDSAAWPRIVQCRV